MNTAVRTPSPSGRPTVKVWDPLVRIFHWSLVGFFALSWLTSEAVQPVHEFSGYVIVGLVIFRLIWGVIGTRYARFTDFIYRPSTVIEYLKGLRHGKVKHYLGHNPAGGAMVIALLLTLVAVTVSGMTLIATDGEGPLAGTALANLNEHTVKDVHEFFANLMLGLIGLHVAGVVLSSLRHGENLVRAMVHGRKELPPTEGDGDR